MALGVEVGLGSGDIVLDGTELPQKGAQPPIFGPCLLWPNGWMHQYTTWYGGRPRPRRHCVRWGASSAPKGARPPILGPCLLWPNARPSQLLLSSCLFVYGISQEPLNGFAPNSQGRRVWSLARTSLNVKVKRKVTRDKNGIFCPFGVLWAVYVW